MVGAGANAGVWVAKTDASRPGWDRSREPLDARPAPALRGEDGSTASACSTPRSTRSPATSASRWSAGTRGLHEALEPTRGRAPRARRPLPGAPDEPVPVVVNEGLAGLRTSRNSAPSEALARAVASALTQAQKKAATDAELLERGGRARTRRRARRCSDRRRALGHERQTCRSALALLERYTDDAPRGALLGHVETVSATLRTRWRRSPGSPPPSRCPELEPVDVVDAADWPAARPAERGGRKPRCGRSSRWSRSTS